jgi:penicillin-insensitive murein endopeptidase
VSTAAITLLLLVVLDSAPDALSFGSGGCGKLQGGVALPCSGPNFEAHSDAACMMGRNFLHPLVQKTVVEAFLVEAFQQLEASAKSRRWQYGEMGKQEGGPLWPHKTHQNGLSADFFVPVVDKNAQPELLPISALNKLGYDLDLDKEGKLKELAIDWRAVGAHLLALEAAGKRHGVRIERVILTPDFHAELFKESPGIKRLAPRFMKQEAWVRHDEHYHVDFEIPRKYRRPLKCGGSK